METELHKYFHGLRVSDIGTMGDVVVLSSNDTVEKAVSVMGKHKILSIPILDKGTCVGLVDTLDIVSFVLSVAPDPLSLQQHELQSLEIAGRAMAFKTLQDVIGLSGRDPYIPIYENDPSTEAIELFAKGIHRAPIFHEDGRIIGTISQSSIVRQLAQNVHVGHLKETGHKSIHDLGLGLVKPITVNQSATVLAALKTLIDNKISAAAVVDDHGKLVGNFSSSDIKGLFKEHWPSFTLSVEEFLKKHSPKSLHPLTVNSDESFSNVCKKMAGAHVHRFWVTSVTSGAVPVGVVSLTDICKACRDTV